VCKVAQTPMPREREYPHTRPTSWIVPIFFLSGTLFALSNCAPLPQRPAISVKPAIAEQLLVTLRQKESAILSLCFVFTSRGMAFLFLGEWTGFFCIDGLI